VKDLFVRLFVGHGGPGSSRARSSGRSGT
jgi:hypothetical protein